MTRSGSAFTDTLGSFTAVTTPSVPDLVEPDTLSTLRYGTGIALPTTIYFKTNDVELDECTYVENTSADNYGDPVNDPKTGIAT